MLPYMPKTLRMLRKIEEKNSCLFTGAVIRGSSLRRSSTQSEHEKMSWEQCLIQGCLLSLNGLMSHYRSEFPDQLQPVT
jgi:hypothetical protein